MFRDDKQEESVANREEYDTDRTIAAVEYRIKRRLLVAQQKAQKVLYEDKGEVAYVDALAQKAANEIFAKARINAMKQMESTINEAQDKAKSTEQERKADKLEYTRSQMLQEAKDKIIEHTDLIISEAEQTAFRILNEAKERARYRTAGEYEDRLGSRNVKNQAIELEPNAPNLLAELRKRYAAITFGEPHVSDISTRSRENTDLSKIEFSVLEGEDKEQIGRYVVHTDSRGIFGKTYEHWGKLLVIRGGVSDWDYQYLQQLTDSGRQQDTLRNSLRDGMRNFAIYNLPVFVWSAAHGREDRYLNDVQFP